MIIKRRSGKRGGAGIGRRSMAIALFVGLAVWARPTSPDPEWEVLDDGWGDASARPTDPGADAAFDIEAHRLIDLGGITFGAWIPDEPEEDLFTGEFESDESVVDGEFYRLDLLVEGLINPPGSVDPLAFDPFAYGEHPIYGFVEIDMDRHVDTGGELDTPQYRYLGNVARFGGQPSGEQFYDRVALDATAFDDNILTPPFVDRHGEEFHLALLGGQFGPGDIEEIDGNGDTVFDEGETWHVSGPFFHRAHGYEAFSLAEGGGHPGEYTPPCELQFRHDLEDDVTQVSLVFPLTNVGAGLMTGEPPGPLNGDPSDQASVHEALDDLQFSALFLTMFPSGLPEEDIIMGWADQEPMEYLEPHHWSITALVGTSYTDPDPLGPYFVWSDVFPNVLRGDFDGDGEYDDDDRSLIVQFIADEDASDGSVDDAVTVLDFARDFSVYDVNYDGVVDLLDVNDFTLLDPEPASDESLWRSGRNTVRLRFSTDISVPGPGEILIQPMLPGGLFGADLSGGFEYSVEEGDQDEPRVLKIVDVDPPDLGHAQWYSIRSVGDWEGGGEFAIEYVVQVGDADNDGAVLNLDAGLINARIPDLDADDQERLDIDGDGTILNADVSVVNVYLPSLPVPKPSGH